ncbi:MAG: TRAP transporter substrate-binding protein [Peptococcaceae bacterium]|nr:MAG: TRAP transporter substrate-binding protein [Peptococcaceae bacterium]
MRVRNILIFASLILLLGLIIAGCGKQPGSTPGEGKITARLAGTMPVEHHITKAEERFERLVEERTGGRVDIQVFSAGQLYTDKDMVDVIPKGGVELAQVNWAMWTGLVPSFGILNIHCLYSDADHFYRALNNEPAQEVIKEMEEKGNLKFLGWLYYGDGYFFSTRPVNKLDDFKGLRIRGMSDYDSVLIKGTGAAPAVLSAAEIYMALQKKTVEGVLTGPTSYVARKYIEVAKYPLENQIGWGWPFALVVNRDFWNKLPPDVQQAMIDAGREVTDWTRQEAKKADEAAWQMIKDTPGVTVCRLPAADDEKMRRIGREAGEKLLAEKIGAERANKLVGMVDALRR